jgi:hypothetical protein
MQDRAPPPHAEKILPNIPRIQQRQIVFTGKTTTAIGIGKNNDQKRMIII